MGRRKQVQPKRCKSTGDEKSLENGESDENHNENISEEESEITMDTKSESQDNDSVKNIPEKGNEENSSSETVLSDTKEDENESSKTEEDHKPGNTSVTLDNDVSLDEKPGKKDNAEKPQIKSSKEKRKSSGDKRRSETPPLKRLMRQDPLPLFMNNCHASLPKKMFKEEHIHSSKWQMPLIPSSAFLSNIKNAPMHPRQHMLKSKPYSNKIFLSPAALSSIHSMGYPNNPKLYDNDQPLDLSKKTGSMKSSSSSSFSHSSIKPSNHNSSENVHLKSRHKYSNGVFQDSVKSSLQSLQQKFGSDYHTRLLQRPMKGLHSMSYEMFNKTCGSDNVLLNSISSLPKKKSPVPSYTETGEKISQEKGEVSLNNNKDLNSNFKKTNSTTDNDEDKHTRHKCVCSKTFTSLYELSLHIQETGHLPAGVKKANLMEYPKLVRGQDMWLNTESEQTKRILRCMQCGESFKSLPMLTVHMMQTQHYTKIVSSEHGRRTHKCSAYCDRDVDRECVFKCKVCNSMFVDMEGLANHMILSGHHKRNVLRTQKTDHDIKTNKYSPSEDWNSDSSLLDIKGKNMPRLSPLADRMSVSSPDSDLMDDSMISCENCGERIETSSFVEHVRTCLHQSMVDAFESRIQKLKSKVDNLQSKDLNEDHKSDNHSEDVKETNFLNELKLKKIKTENIEEGDSESVSVKDQFKKEKPENGIFEKLIKTEPTDEKTEEKSDENSQNTESKDRNPEKNESAKKLDILNPEDGNLEDQGGNSALQAMESFIQKSFSTKFSYGRNKFQMNLFNKQESLSPLLKFEKYRKYFQPSLLMQNISSKVEGTELSESKGQDSAKDDLEKLEKLCENVNKRQASPKSNTKAELADKQESNTPSESLSNKYLNIDEEEQTSKKSSALDSLSSFVYGQSLDSEHPLDSLQRLITKTDIPEMATNLRPMSSSPQTSIPLNLCVKKELEDDELMDDGISDGSHSDSESDSAVEYHCVACSRHFASKGTYRYHLSRCHLSTIKKYGIKEAFNMSPYVYLPLDHTAKFSKYFKMAEELAKKENSSEKT